MSKTVQQRRGANKNKVPLVTQRLLAAASKSDGTPLLGQQFTAQYMHNRQVSIVSSKEFQAEITALHATNPFKELAYGRGKFTYVSVELAGKIQELHAKFGLEAASKENVGKGWSYAELNIDGEKPANLPPSTDHTKFVQYVQSEEIYASDEEKEAMKMLLAAMGADLETIDGTTAAAEA
ncbi:hypothetical protein [Burkholderia phage FLC9]|nr:hypothetical protein [Burkholderia phage FLC9]